MGKRNRTGGYTGRFQPGGEMKFVDEDHTISMTSAPVAASTVLTGELAVIPQGNTQSTRVGRKCVLKSLQIRGYINYKPGTTDQAGDLAYIWLVQDTQTNGAHGSATDIFESGNPTRVMRNMANSSRFRILKRWVYRFQMTSTNIAGTEHVDSYQVFDDYLKLNIPMEYDGTSGVIAQQRTNSLFFVVGSLIGSDAQLQFSTRLRFADP